MSKNRNILIAVLVVIIVGLMVQPALARQYRPALIGSTRWVSVSEPAYEGRDQSTQPVTTVPSEKSDLANVIDGVGEFVGDTVETVGVAFGETVEATGEVGGGIIEGTGEFVGDAGGGILTWVGDVAVAAGEIVGGTWEFLFGGWG